MKEEKQKKTVYAEPHYMAQDAGTGDSQSSRYFVYHLNVLVMVWYFSDGYWHDNDIEYATILYSKKRTKLPHIIIKCYKSDTEMANFCFFLRMSNVRSPDINTVGLQLIFACGSSWIDGIYVIYICR